jgi:hypothetical protein
MVPGVGFESATAGDISRKILSFSFKKRKGFCNIIFI